MHTQEFTQTQFQRKPELTLQKRFIIAYIVIFQNTWGTITRLAYKYNTSRQFIYDTVEIFKKNNYFYFSDDFKNDLEDCNSIKFILSQRMEGKSSIPGISTIMKRFGIENNSVGYISQTLKEIGKQVGNKFDIENTDGFTFSICCDELFANQSPILITVDPISLAILNIELSDNRKQDAWIHHWQNIKEQGIGIDKLINDEGTGMKAAKTLELTDIDRQTDTFHAVAHRLGLYSNRLESIAYKAIENEYKCLDLLNNAKSVEVISKRRENYEKAKQETIKAINLSENFDFLYHCLLECFQVFDNEGNLKDAQKVTDDFNLGLELLKTLENKEINKEVKSIEQCKNELFTFFKSAKQIIDTLSKTVDKDILKLFCLAWQYRKNGIKSKNNYRKNKYLRREQYVLNDVKELIVNDYDTLKAQVYKQLNHIIQSSAAVECINSLLRPYLNTSKNRVSQELLNLFMFYHNHRRFLGGERKGKTPYEIATNTENQLDWIQLLIDKIVIN
jgi:hypothetical protein